MARKCTIIEEQKLRTKDLEGKNLKVLDVIWYHGFEQFTQPLKPYVENWVREFYEAYGKLLPDKINKGKFQETQDVAKVRGLNVKCDGAFIYLIYGDMVDTHHYFTTHT